MKEIEREQVTQHIAHEYGMCNIEVQEFTDFVKFRLTRSHYAIICNGKKFFLKLCNQTDTELIKREAMISKSFDKNHFVNCPKIIDSIYGLPYTEYNGKIAVLYEFIEAKNLGPKIFEDGSIEYYVSRKTYSSLAMLHANLRELDIPSIQIKSISVEETLGKIAQIMQLIDGKILAGDDTRNNIFHKEYLCFVQGELKLNSEVVTKIESSIQKQLIHGDIYGQNIMLHEGKTVFIDWETAMIYYRIFDVIYSLHFSYSPPTEKSQDINMEKIIETLATYHQVERFTDDELRYAMDIYYLDRLTNIQLLWDIYFHNVDYKENMIRENLGILTWLKENKDIVTLELAVINYQVQF